MKVLADWFAIVLFFCCSSAFGQPILPSGDFERGLAGWAWSQQEMARGEFRVVPAVRRSASRFLPLPAMVNGTPAAGSAWQRKKTKAKAGAQVDRSTLNNGGYKTWRHGAKLWL